MSEQNMQENALITEAASAAASPSVWSDKAAFEQLLRAANMLSQTSLVPQSFQGKAQDCFLALEIASRMNVSPMVVMQNMYVVKNRPVWAGQACTMLINSCGKFENVRHVYTGKKDTDSRGCYVEATRIDTGEVVQGVEVTMQMAKAEGWTSNPKWRNMPELMLAYRASAFFARVHCPEALMGVQTAEEAFDVSAQGAKSASEALRQKVGNAKKVSDGGET